MAITKNHTIDATLKKAIAYICNPDKTDSKLLVYSYGCSPETADIEFEWTRQNAKGNSKHLARHLIQAFEPGETTPEQAHEIGKTLADEVLGGKYEYILTTHIDKGHIHNHIIFNDVNFVNYKHSHINKRWYYNTRQISDRLCKEYGLSVIPQNMDKVKAESNHKTVSAGNTYREKLKTAIDKAITKSNDFEDFLLRMEINGYEIKQGKYLSFRAKEQERFIRSKSIGAYYTEDYIKKRIANNRSLEHKAPTKSINLIIDIQNCVKAQKSKGYEHWAKINNLKQISNTLNYLTENNITSYKDLEKAVNKISSDFDTVLSKIKNIEKQINNNSILIKQLEIYRQYKPLYEQYQKANNKTDFANQHHSEIILFETAAKKIKNCNISGLFKLKQDNTALTEQKTIMYQNYKKLKKQSAEINTVKSNVDMIFNHTNRIAPQIEIEK